MTPPKRQREPDVVDQFVAAVQDEMTKQAITMTELARRAGIGRPYLYRILNGEQTPSLEWAQKVGNVLGLAIHFEKIK